jgi:sRNA-binding protein
MSDTPERPTEEVASPAAPPVAESVESTPTQPETAAPAVADDTAHDDIAHDATPTSPAVPEAPARVRAPEPSPAETGAALASLFPALFGGPGPKPVKLRIQADIQARAPGRFTKKALSIFLHRHTTSTGYLKALVAEGATRIDLDGASAGEIDPVHIEAARVELARRWEIVQARRAAERAAAQASAPRHAAPAAGDGAAAAPADARPPRPARGPRTDGGPRLDRAPRPPRPDAGPRPPRPAQGPRPDRPERGPRLDRPARGPRLDGPPRGASQPPRPQANAAPAERRGPPPETALPTDPAQRERLMLLRAFEASPLKKANFCALKRITEADLDAQLALARQELAARRA